jgi:hypothetical protein
MNSRGSGWVFLMGTALGLLGCGGTKVLTVTFPKSDGNSEYWVCDRDATHCRGRVAGDVDDLDYKPGMDSLSPPIECPHGAARMDVVIKGNRVLRIGYECAQPPVPTSLPGHESCSEEDGPTGLPEGDTDGPTGLPEEPVQGATLEEGGAPSTDAAPAASPAASASPAVPAKPAAPASPAGPAKPPSAPKSSASGEAE